MRLVLKSFSPLAIREATSLLVGIIATTCAGGVRTIPIPITIHRFDLLRSPHIDKRARDQMEIRTYKRVIHVPYPTPTTAAALMSADLPAGVAIRVRP